MKWMRKCITTTLVTVLGLSGAGLAQMDVESEIVEVQPGQLELSLSVGYEESHKTDIDDGGEFKFRSYNFSVTLGMALGDNLKLTLGYQYLADEYDFDGPTGFGALDPWDDLETQNINVLFSHQLSNDWTVFGGPIGVYSRETSGDIGDSGTWGGVVGASFIYSKDLVIGGGVGIITSLEEDVRFFPIIILNWKLSPDLRIATETNSRRSGLELVYQATEGMEFALGAAYEFKRFRLDNTGIAPNGVGEQTSLPLWIRASFNFDHNTTLNLLGGVRFGGELRIEDRNGNGLNRQDFDAASFVGLSLDIRF